MFGVQTCCGRADTVTELLVVPPGPVQDKVYVRFAVKFPVLCEPEIAFAPVHPPEAVQLVALVDDHVSIAEAL